jgi:hypothetical protein
MMLNYVFAAKTKMKNQRFIIFVANEPTISDIQFERR